MDTLKTPEQDCGKGTIQKHGNKQFSETSYCPNKQNSLKA